jgi:hypothetical protein
MPSEQLTLVAQIFDRFSAPLRDMQRQLGLFDQQGRKVHTEGIKLSRLHAAEYATPD